MRNLLFVLALLVATIAGCGTEVPSAPKVRVVAFTAAWCGPCRQAKPALLCIATAGVDVQVIDVDRQPDIAKRYGVASVPCFFVFAPGREPASTHDILEVVRLVRR